MIIIIIIPYLPFSCIFLPCLGAVAKRRNKRLLISSCASVRHYIFIEQLGYKWVDFHEILFWGFLLKSIDQIEVWFKSDKK
jgi:hypothetical protein